MSSSVRRGNQVSPATVGLVLLLLALVAGVSRLVTDPPAQPPKAAPAVMQAEQQKQMTTERARRQSDMQQKYRENMKAAPRAIASPDTIDISNQYFMKHKPGEDGIKQVDKELARTTAIYKESLRKRNADAAKTGGPAKATGAPGIDPPPPLQETPQPKK